MYSTASRIQNAVALLTPTLLALHRYPQTVFYQEWWCVAIATCALFPLAVSRSSLRFRASPASPAMGIVLLATLASLFAGAESVGLGWAVYIVFGAGVVLMAQSFAIHAERASVAAMLAAGVLLCAVLQSAVGFYQLVASEVPDWIMVRLYSAIYGNVAQSNHFANLLWLGMGSGLYLWHGRRLPTWLALPAAATIAVMAAFSASRSVWLFTAALPVLALLYFRGGRVAEGRRLIAGSLVVAGLSVLAQVWVSTGVGLQGTKVVAAASRVGETGSNGQRLFDWKVAVKTALEHPLTGAGVGTFAWRTGLEAAKSGPASFVRIGENAHNTILHLAAELGIVVTLAVVGLFGWWLWRRFREPPTAEGWWALAIVAVIGLHSMVEYPLWYTYFMLPFCLAIGVADAGDEKLPVFEFDSRWLLIPVAIGALMLAWTWRDYHILEDGYATIDDANRDVARIESLALKIDPRSMFAPHAGILRIRNWRETDTAKAGEIAGVCDTALRAKPSLEVMERCISAYALAGRDTDAQLVVDVACGAYPAIYLPDVKRRVSELHAKGHALLTCAAGR